MKTISEYRSGIDPPKKAPEKAHCVFWGAAIGVLVALVTLLVASTYYGATIGLEPIDCVILGCVTTVLLSQPVAAVGLGAGAACGGAYAWIAGCRRR